MDYPPTCSPPSSPSGLAPRRKCTSTPCVRELVIGTILFPQCKQRVTLSSMSSLGFYRSTLLEGTLVPMTRCAQMAGDKAYDLRC